MGCHQAKNHKLVLRLPHTLQVHLQTGEEHDVEHAYLAKQLEGVVALEDIETVFAHQHSRKYHADDMGYPQLTHDDGGKQDDAEHDEKY